MFLFRTPLEATIAEGNRGHHHSLKESGTITCADGFTVSVIAGGGTYCHPRPVMCLHLADHEWVGKPYRDEVAHDFEGPYDEVEVGFPSSRPEPWEEWHMYAEESKTPTSTVYCYVPVGMVRALVKLHGGEVF